MARFLCECEHISHFRKPRITPRGKVAHGYGKPVEEKELKRVITPFGKFFVCSACEQDCLERYAEHEPT